MGKRRTVTVTDSSLRSFAERLRTQLGAERVLLFGPHARGTATQDSDYDFVIVAGRFDSVPPLEREYGLHDLFYEVVGVAPLNFVCLTPEEFVRASGGATLVSAVLPEAIDLLRVNDCQTANLTADSGSAAGSGQNPPSGLSHRYAAASKAGRAPTVADLDPAIVRFAARLRDEIGAERVLLFGSYARGTASRDSDYDLIVVAKSFESTPLLRRGAGLHDLFYEVGGNAPMDIICLTPEEFDAARHGVTLVSAILPEAIDLLPRGTPVS